ncbi:AMP-binding protein [Saccharopolyspora sp. NPDC050642]|uniref:AMP-binding protein n=1 Tax=Saccharopolyspora sp. NPDC050642 TaxID=3157099 RepID=UPI0033D8F71B
MSDLVHSEPTVGSFIFRSLRRYPDRTAFSWNGRTMSYAAALELIGRLQAVFSARGLGRGNTIAMLAGNRAEAWCAKVAAQASGIGVTDLHPFGAAPDQAYQVADSAADALIVDCPRFAERAAELIGRFERERHVFSLGPSDFGVDLLAAAESAGAAGPVDVASGEDVSTLKYTGGTTGRPKGVLRRHASALRASLVLLSDFEFPNEPRYLATAPISHVTGTNIEPTLALGGTVHLLDGFDPDAVLATIARERINTALFVPTMIYALLDHPDLDRTDLSSLELLLYGASSMSPSLLSEGIERLGPVFAQLYGQTECYPISYLRKSDHADSSLIGSCGMPVGNCEVTVRGDDGNEVPAGEPGEICVRGPVVMERYVNQPDVTAEALQGDWLHTGDIAYRDDRGYLHIVDRKKDMIVSGGFNVFPREVEDALTGHDAVSVAAVYGVADDKWGEAVTATVVLRPGHEVTPDELIRHVKSVKGSVQAPKQIRVVEELPRTPVGKIDKKALRAQWGPRS